MANVVVTPLLEMSGFYKALLQIKNVLDEPPIQT